MQGPIDEPAQRADRAELTLALVLSWTFALLAWAIFLMAILKYV